MIGAAWGRGIMPGSMAVSLGYGKGRKYFHIPVCQYQRKEREDNGSRF
jgi:hypothetical protein